MRFTERTLVVNCKQVNGHHCKPKPLFRGATPASPNCQRLAVDPCVLPREPCVLPRESRNHLSPGQVAGRDRGVVWFWSDFNARFAYPAAQSRSLDRQSRFDAGTFRSSAFSIGNFDRQFRSGGGKKSAIHAIKIGALQPWRQKLRSGWLSNHPLIAFCCVETGWLTKVAVKAVAVLVVSFRGRFSFVLHSRRRDLQLLRGRVPAQYV